MKLPARGRLIRLVLICAVLLAVYRLFFASGPGGPRMAADTPPVRVATALAQDMPYFLNGLGTVEPSSDVLVTSRVDGQLVKLHFTEGRRVAAGDLLAEIDPAPLKPNWRRPRATCCAIRPSSPMRAATLNATPSW